MRSQALLLALSILTISGSLFAAEDKALEGREAVTTAKERLVNKAADPQRVDDCNIPVEKRDPDTTRPSDCRHLEPGSEKDD